MRVKEEARKGRIDRPCQLELTLLLESSSREDASRHTLACAAGSWERESRHRARCDDGFTDQAGGAVHMLWQSRTGGAGSDAAGARSSRLKVATETAPSQLLFQGTQTRAQRQAASVTDP
jgi:hypothetical protein